MSTHDTDRDKRLADQMVDSREKTLAESLALLIRGGVALSQAANEIRRLRGDVVRLTRDNEWLTKKIQHGCTGTWCERCDSIVSLSPDDVGKKLDVTA